MLVAEFAARRGVLDVALGNYLQQAARTHDAGVAARATRMARYFGADRATLEAALLWAAAEPEEPEAQFTAATELARAGRPREAFAHMRAAHDAGGTSNFAVIAASSLELAQSERREMLAELEALGPGNEVDVLIARAVLLQSVDENELALARVREVLALDPDNYQAILIEAQVYQNLGDTEKAYARIEQALRDTPDNTRLRLQYARLLAKTDLARSEEQFRILVDAAAGRCRTTAFAGAGLPRDRSIRAHERAIERIARGGPATECRAFLSRTGGRAPGRQ